MPNNDLIERLDLHILETKAGYDVLYDEMLDILKQLLSMNIRRERMIPIYKDETWPADLTDKSSLRKYKKNYKFILTVTDIIRKIFMGYSIKE